MSRPMVLETDSPEATQQIARRLGGALRTGHLIALIGPLGSGKTTFVKGLAAGAGVPDSHQVNSPTFVLVNEYDAGPACSRVYHIDAYRLRGAEDLDALGFDEMGDVGAVVIEWADRVEPLLAADRLTITFEPVGDRGRRLHCEAGGPLARELLATLEAG